MTKDEKLLVGHDQDYDGRNTLKPEILLLGNAKISIVFFVHMNCLHPLHNNFLDQSLWFVAARLLEFQDFLISVFLFYVWERSKQNELQNGKATRLSIFVWKQQL